MYKLQDYTHKRCARKGERERERDWAIQMNFICIQRRGCRIWCVRLRSFGHRFRNEIVICIGRYMDRYRARIGNRKCNELRSNGSGFLTLFYHHMLSYCLFNFECTMKCTMHIRSRSYFVFSFEKAATNIRI